MENPKLLELLKSLSGKEREHLKDFAESRYFNQNARISTALEMLLHDVEAPGDQELSKENLFKKLYPDTKYDDLKLRHLLSDLLKLTEKYLAVQHFLGNELAIEIETLQSLHEKRLEKHFFSAERKAVGIVNKARSHDEILFFQYKFQLIHQRNAVLSNGHTTQNHFIPAMDALDKFYYFSKLKLCCEMLSYEQSVNIVYDAEIINEVLYHFERHSYPQVPVIDIYYKILSLLLKPEDEARYLEFLKDIKANSHHFSLQELREVYYYSLNYCIKMLNDGYDNYLHEIFDLYKTMLPADLLLEKNHISAWNYKNVVVTALRLNEFDWAKKFMEIYKEKLLPEFRESAHSYSLAKYYFYKKDFKHVLKLLLKSEFGDDLYNLDGKLMLMKSYYELHETGQLLSLLENIKIFIQKNKILNDTYKVSYLNLIKVIKKLAVLTQEDSDKIAKLKASLDKNVLIADIPWLEEKIEELEMVESFG